MNVLVVGGGGREHAVCWKLKQSPLVDKLYCAPGNAGIAELAECVNVKATDVDGIVKFVDEHPDIEFTVVTPDDPLALGLVDKLEAAGHPAFGPKANAAIIEASKAFSKALMKKYNIPTAAFEVFDDYEKALAYVRNGEFPVVLKADGLALGKGVLICETLESAEEGLKQIMLDGAFGAAGNKVVVEEFLTGAEVSVLTFTDGKTVVPMITSCDHKRALTGDKGLNTGGMGTFSPCAFYGEQTAKEVEQNILLPTIAAMNAEGRTFQGVLYFGLMKTAKGMKVIEYNARFGDPETQVVLPMLKGDLMEIFMAVREGRLSEVKMDWEDGACVCVMLASGGYPEAYEKGKEMTFGRIEDGVLLFHSGTAKKDGKLVTAGGRVLGVTAKADTLDEAREIAYRNADRITFEGKHFRTDIGIKYRDMKRV